MAGETEKEIADRLAQAHEENERFASSAYEGGPGLSERLRAIEDALVRVARAVDEVRSG